MISHGSRNARVQDEAYQVIFDQQPAPEEIDLFRRGSPANPRVVGDREFIAGTLRAIGITQRPRAKVQRATPDEIPNVISRMLEMFDIFCNQRLSPTLAERWIRVSALNTLRSKSPAYQ